MSPLGIAKSKTAAAEVPLLVTVALEPAAPVLTVPTAMVAAAPSAPSAPQIPTPQKNNIRFSVSCSAHECDSDTSF